MAGGDGLLLQPVGSLVSFRPCLPPRLPFFIFLALTRVSGVTTVTSMLRGEPGRRLRTLVDSLKRLPASLRKGRRLSLEMVVGLAGTQSSSRGPSRTTGRRERSACTCCSPCRHAGVLHPRNEEVWCCAVPAMMNGTCMGTFFPCGCECASPYGERRVQVSH